MAKKGPKLLLADCIRLAAGQLAVVFVIFAFGFLVFVAVAALANHKNIYVN